MRKEKRFNKFKKVILTVMSLILLVFSMPVKSEATILADAVSLLFSIPDGIMWVTQVFVAGRSSSEVSEKINIKGVQLGRGDEGSIYNFYITPYNIFTAGDFKSYIETNTLDEVVYENLPIFDANFFRTDKDIDEYVKNLNDQYRANGTKLLNGNNKILTAVKEDNDSINSASILRNVIGNAYRYLRNLAIVLMMVVLLYIGIRIMVSSVASEQSKYKQMLVDWVVGLALIMVMHYIMSFVMNFNDLVVDMLRNDQSDTYFISFPALGNSAVAGNGIGEEWYEFFDDKDDEMFINLHLDIPGNIYDAHNGKWQDTYLGILNSHKGVESYNDGDVDRFNDSTGTIVIDTHADWGEDWPKDKHMKKTNAKINARIVDEDRQDESDMCVYKGNMMEYIRTLSTYSPKYITLYSHHREKTDNGTYKTVATPTPMGTTFTDKGIFQIGLCILYLALVIETIMFMIIYFKRLFQLAYLTMIAPIVAFMYPLDKVGDGKAQAFNTWLKDYIFNALLQPLHLLLYTVFIAAASDIVSKNIIYALVMFGFMIPAEKYFKKILGFDKASTGGGSTLAGALGGMMALRGFDKFTGLGPHGRRSSGGGKDRTRRRYNFGKSDIKDRTSANDAGDTGGAPVPSSDGRRGTSPVPSSDGRTGGRPVPSGDGRRGATPVPSSDGRTGGRPVPSADGDREHSKTANRARALGHTLGNRVIRGVAGKEWNEFKALSKHGKAAAVARKLGMSALRTSGRVAGAAIVGAAGTAVGAATAMATGDFSNLGKGALTGVLGGWKQGGNFADWVGNGVDEFATDYSEKYGNLESDWKDTVRTDQAKADFADTYNRAPTEEQEEALDLFSPFMDGIGKDEDKLERLHDGYHMYRNCGVDDLHAREYAIADEKARGKYNLATDEGIKYYMEDNQKAVEKVINAKKDTKQQELEEQIDNLSDSELEKMRKTEQKAYEEKVKAERKAINDKYEKMFDSADPSRQESIRQRKRAELHKVEKTVEKKYNLTKPDANLDAYRDRKKKEARESVSQEIIKDHITKLRKGKYKD